MSKKRSVPSLLEAYGQKEEGGPGSGRKSAGWNEPRPGAAGKAPTHSSGRPPEPGKEHPGHEMRPPGLAQKPQDRARAADIFSLGKKLGVPASEIPQPTNIKKGPPPPAPLPPSKKASAWQATQDFLAKNDPAAARKMAAAGVKGAPPGPTKPLSPDETPKFKGRMFGQSVDVGRHYEPSVAMYPKKGVSNRPPIDPKTGKPEMGRSKFHYAKDKFGNRVTDIDPKTGEPKGGWEHQKAVPYTAVWTGKNENDPEGKWVSAAEFKGMFGKEPAKPAAPTGGPPEGAKELPTKHRAAPGDRPGKVFVAPEPGEEKPEKPKPSHEPASVWDKYRQGGHQQQGARKVSDPNTK